MGCQGKVHIAIVDMPTIRKIAQGVKTIESRFSKNRIKPHGLVDPDDMVLLKSSGGGIFGYFFVDHVETLTNFNIVDIKERYNDRITADESFWTKKTDARYASLIQCKKPVMAESGVHFKRTGMDGWIIRPQNLERQVICFSGQICSGKTGYAKGLTEILEAQYIHFGSIIKRYAAENGFGDDRAAIQNAGQHFMDTMGSDALIELAIRQLDGTPPSRHIVFDGVRHAEIYHAIKDRFSGATLIYVDAKSQERYKRYLERSRQTITYQEFMSMNEMPVEREIPALEKEADYIVKSSHEKDLGAAINITSRIISAMLTGQIHKFKAGNSTERGKMLAVVGAQYGSEGKGVITAAIAQEYSVHVRVGSPNAGHTFHWNDNVHVMQCIPCGWINPNAKIILGRGSLLNMEYLISEIEHIEKYYPEFKKRLYIDAKAGILLETFKQKEGGIDGDYNRRIGSTGEGVGEARIARIKRDPNEFLYFKDVAKEYGLFDCMMKNTPSMIAECQDRGENILLEGTQGCALSLLHGNWPYVTSIDTNAAALLSEAGIAPSRLTNVLIVARTFPIRVSGNSGDLKFEIDWNTLSAELGRPVLEYTTVTKRPRRIGKWDDNLIQEAILLNKPTSMALTFLDYIDPSCRGISEFEKLNDKSKAFITAIEQKFSIPIAIIGTGGETFTTIRKRDEL